MIVYGERGSEQRSTTDRTNVDTREIFSKDCGASSVSNSVTIIILVKVKVVISQMKNDDRNELINQVQKERTLLARLLSCAQYNPSKFRGSSSAEQWGKKCIIRGTRERRKPVYPREYI